MVSKNFETGCFLIPATIILFFFFYVFFLWMTVISLTDSHLVPEYNFVGLRQYVRLFESSRWIKDTSNLIIYGFSVISLSVVLGYLLSIILFERNRGGVFFLAVFMIPLSISFIVTGIAWQWILNPQFGLQQAVRNWGWSDFSFGWLNNPNHSLSAIVMASVWQQTGLCVVLFLAGLRSIDRNIWLASRVEGISVWRTYFYVVTPMMRPVLFLVVMLLSCTVIKSYDIVIALTGGGPGFSSDLPARFVMEEIMNRQELGLGAAGACLMFVCTLIILLPYIYREFRRS